MAASLTVAPMALSLLMIPLLNKSGAQQQFTAWCCGVLCTCLV